MFVVFEGIDGSGKTSISNRVAAEFARQGRSVKHLRAEGRFASPIVEGIREFARNSQHLELCWEAEFLLYVARDVQLMHEMLRPALACRLRRLREQVARHCKEALDGFEGVDSPEAWALREVSYDIWPSSVVKTLGPLADTEGGRAVIERQLAAYPEDLSLLRHVARIALELHRGAPPPTN